MYLITIFSMYLYNCTPQKCNPFSYSSVNDAVKIY